MRLISWNVAGRVKRLNEQMEAIAGYGPDVVAFQEVTLTTAPLLRERLVRHGLTHCEDSFRLCRDASPFQGPRKYGQLVASRWPLQPLPPSEFRLPWPERVLSASIASPSGAVELHTTGIPPGCNNGWTKIEMFE